MQTPQRTRIPRRTPTTQRCNPYRLGARHRASTLCHIPHALLKTGILLKNTFY